MLLAIAVILIVLISTALAIGGQVGILVTLLAKPIIDMTWNMPVFGILNPGMLAGGLIPILVLIRLLADGKQLNRVPFIAMWMLYLVYNTVTYSQLLFGNEAIEFADNTFRILNGFAGYLMIQVYFSEREAFKKLLIIYLLAGVIPIAIAHYQIATGVVWRYTELRGLARYTGLYHDLGTQRLYILQTFTGALLYWSYFLPKGKAIFQKLVLIALSAAAFISLYFTFSKAATVVVILWLLIWTIGRRWYLPTFVIIIGFVVLNIILENRLITETLHMFGSEISIYADESGVYATEEGREVALSGRWGLWAQFVEFYWNQPLIYQIFGSGRERAAHNDFLLFLLTGGMVGLLIYTALLTVIGIQVTKNFLRERSPLNVMAAMLFAMWLVDATGLVPSGYPSYQWYVWGIIGLSFKGVRFDTADAGVKDRDLPVKKPVRRFIHLARKKAK